MALIDFSALPQEIRQRVVLALSENGGYQAEVDGQPNPESRLEFARRRTREWMKDEVVRYEAAKAQQTIVADIAAVGEAARQKAEAEIDLGN